MQNGRPCLLVMCALARTVRPSNRMKNAHTFVTAVFCVLALAGATGCRHKVTLQELPASEIETTLFLIGDAGEPDP